MIDTVTNVRAFKNGIITCSGCKLELHVFNETSLDEAMYLLLNHRIRIHKNVEINLALTSMDSVKNLIKVLKKVCKDTNIRFTKNLIKGV